MSDDASTEAEMPCPNCDVALSPNKTERGVVYICSHCHGRSTTLPVLRRALGDPLVHVLWSHARVIREDGGKNCPACHLPMRDVVTTAKSGKVELDVCPRCALVWFDRQEFEGFPQRPPRLAPKPLPLEAREAIGLANLKIDELRRKRLGSGDDDYDVPPESSWQWIPSLFGLPVEAEPGFERAPWLTGGLSAVLIAVFAATWSNLTAVIEEFGLIPADAWRHGGATLVTSFFLHGSWLHVLGNVYFLLIFGDNVEIDLGRWKYAMILLLAAFAGDFLHVALDVRPNVPCVGASGGISGVLTYYALRFPEARISFLLRYWYYYRWIHLPAYAAFLLWIGWQFVVAWLQTQAAGDVSGLAHLGGASAGLACCF